MKTLFLVRHADAHQGKDGLPDRDRPLVPKGEKNARKMAKRLKNELVAPDLIISSPAERALATAQIFADVLRYPAKNIILKPDIYDCTAADSFFEIIRNIKNKHHTVLFIGHEPTLSEFCSLLVVDFHASIPKTGVVGVRSKKENWRELAKGDCEICLFDFPANKAKKADITKRFRTDLGKNIETDLFALFTTIDPEVAKNIKSSVKKASMKLAKRFAKAAEDYGDKDLLYKITQNYCNKFTITELGKPELKKQPDAPKSNESKNEFGSTIEKTAKPKIEIESKSRGQNVGKGSSVTRKLSPKKPTSKAVKATPSTKKVQSRNSAVKKTKTGTSRARTASTKRGLS